MSPRLIVSIVLISLLLAASTGGVRAQPGQVGAAENLQVALGSAFTFQGQLRRSGTLLNGNCGFRFGLWHAASGGAQLGNTQTVNSVQVRDGSFTVRLK